MGFQVKGQVKQILAGVSGTSKAGKEWAKQEFIIETEEQFPKNLAFTLFGDKMDLMNGINAGDNVEVNFGVESREFNGRWFHNINAYGVSLANQTHSAVEYPPVNADRVEATKNDSTSNTTEDTTDDLPF